MTGTSRNRRADAGHFQPLAPQQSLNQVVRNAPPNKPEIEKALLGAMLTSSDVPERIVGMVKKDDFYFPPHQILYDTMQSMARAGQGIDLLTLATRLEQDGQLANIGGPVYLAELGDTYVSPFGAESWAQELRSLAQRRAMVRIGQMLIEHGFDPTVETVEFASQAQKVVDDVLEDRVNVNVQKPSAMVESYLNYLQDLAERKEGGVPSPIYKLNQLIGGHHPGEVMILAGRPGNGKTALALEFARYSMRKEYPTGIFSLEMMRNLLLNRVVSSHSQVEAQKFRTGKFDDDDWPRIYQSADWLEKQDPYLRIWDRPSLTPSEFRAQCRKWVREIGLKYVVLDYLQLVRPDTRGGSREREVAEASRAIKEVAGEFGLAVLLLAQLNREAEKSKRPLLSHLRESGAAEQDADIILFIRPWDSTQVQDVVEITLDVAKGRSNATGSADCLFRRNYLQFVNKQYLRKGEKE